MPDDLYERDILLWSERETALLRRLASGEQVNATVDWTNVIEELADVGLAELHAVESLLQQAMAHLLKLYVAPESQAAAHWRGEVIAFLGNAARRYAPSMRQRIDLPGLWRLAVRQIAATHPGATLPDPCPWTLAELLAEDAEPGALVKILQGSL